jgi:hypothetical protein
VPRPNPPRRRTRQRRRNPNVVRVPDQERDEQGDAPAQRAPAPPPPRSARAAVRGTTPAPAVLDTSEWSRQSLFVMVALMVVGEALVNLLVYMFSKSTAPIGLYIVVLNPYALLASAFIAMPLAKRITHEARYLRIVETALVSVFIFFIWYFFLAAAGGLLVSTGNTAKTPVTHTTPLPQLASPSAAATPTPASGGSSANPSPSSSSTSTLPVEPTATSYFVLGVVDMLPFAITPLIFYPVYRRFRFRGRMPRPPTTPARK